MPPDHAIESPAIAYSGRAAARLFPRGPAPLPRNGRGLLKVWSNASVTGKSLTLPTALLYFARDLTSSFLH